jgi:hypothetical protein
MFFRRKPDQRLRLAEMMRVRKAQLPDALSPEAAADLEQAKRRCLDCNAKALCDEALKTGDPNGFSLFCGNCHYVQRLRKRSLNFK